MFNWSIRSISHQGLKVQDGGWRPRYLSSSPCWSTSAALPVIWGHWDQTSRCCRVCSAGKISGTSSHLRFSSSCTIFSLGGNKAIKRSIMSVCSRVNLQFPELLFPKGCVRMSENVTATHTCAWCCVSEARHRGSGGAPAAPPFLCVMEENKRTCLIQRLCDFQRRVSSTFTGAQVAALSRSPDCVVSCRCLSNTRGWNYRRQLTP